MAASRRTSSVTIGVASPMLSSTGQRSTWHPSNSLLTHEAGGMRERGLSDTLAFDATPETERGLSLSLTQTMGGQSVGGADALLERTTLAGMGADDDGLSARRLDAQLGCG